MVQTNGGSPFSATVSSLLQKVSKNTYKKFIRGFQLHKPQIRNANANYLKHLLLVVQCKRIS